MITRYGYDVFFTVLAIIAIALVLNLVLIEGKLLKYSIAGVLLVFLFFTLNFFRDPERVTPQGDHLILAPADGKVVLIKELHEAEYLKCQAVQVSIFMSPLNVHVNRYPISGRIGYFKHIPGKFLVAMEEKSSDANERTLIGVENPKAKILFKQIAGFVARRIVAPITVGDTAVAGQRFGMIKFGSRVDVIMPKTVEVKVRVGEHTVAGETVIGVIS